jgi:glycosyltransferase involved in cell wall biosynthesis
MKIGMLVSNFLPRQGGAEYVVHHLTIALTQLGHQVTVLAPSDPTARPLRFPYTVHRALRIPLVSLETQRLLQATSQHKRRGFDLIHAHIAWEAGFVGAKLKAKCDVPLVITPHGGDVQTIPEIQYGLCLNPSTNEKVRFAFGAANLITAVSQRIRLAVVERGGSPERIRLVAPGTEFERIQTLPADDPRPSFGLSAADFVVLSVGRNSRVKDVPTLIEALRIASSQEMRIRCVLVGPDDSIRAPVEEAGLADRVTLLGRIPPGFNPRRPADAILQTPYPELIAAYRACDVFVSSSLTESFNTAALDAFACGRPAIVTNTQGFMDVLNDGVNGWSVPPRDPDALAEKILHLARNRDFCRTMGEAARATASNYDWNAVAKRFVSVYEEALAECG